MTEEVSEGADLRGADRQCKKCRLPQRKDCDGNGWLEALGPCRDGSYVTSRPCSNDRPYFE